MPKAERDALPTSLFRAVSRVLELHAPGATERAALAAFRRFVSRAFARRLLAEWSLAEPDQARLLRTEGVDRELDAALTGDAELEAALDRWWSLDAPAPPRPPELLGARFEALLGLELTRVPDGWGLCSTRTRKKTGAFYTPRSLTAEVVREALARLCAQGRLDAADLCVCDPACGAGAFLIEVARQLEARGLDRASIVANTLVGTDIDPTAVAVAELVMFAWSGVLGRFAIGDALGGRGFEDSADSRGDAGAVDFAAAFPASRARGFDLVIGNPPWIAYAGRAAQPLSQARRQKLRERYAGFRGYPTLHGAFVERACRLAPNGVVALVVPSPIADLDGYRPLRSAVGRTHLVCEPMIEFGQDAFQEVTQPCFALIARPLAPGESAPDHRFRLLERMRRGGVACAVEEPVALSRLSAGEPFPKELFGEMGFQTTRAVSQRLLRRAAEPDAHYTYPLLEGRVVKEFVVGRPALFLRPDTDLLSRERCRLRPPEDYRRARFVVRQTAKMPIAALHQSGLPFRNSLLAGFHDETLPPELLVGLLNSSLYRALHVARQRDARQAAFPQVKIAHLRALPRPPRASSTSRVRELVERITVSGPSAELKRRLDDAVYDLFELSPSERQEIHRFSRERLPELARADT
jgi:SAM-dependent methyltransferase